jgi:hypothetical protein
MTEPLLEARGIQRSFGIAVTSVSTDNLAGGAAAADAAGPT